MVRLGRIITSAGQKCSRIILTGCRSEAQNDLCGAEGEMTFVQDVLNAIDVLWLEVKPLLPALFVVFLVGAVLLLLFEGWVMWKIWRLRP